MSAAALSAAGRWQGRSQAVPPQNLIGSLGDARPVIHPQAWVAPGAVVVGRVTLGRAASVWYGSVLRADTDEIAVGADVNIQDLCCLHVDPGEPVTLEDRVSLGHRATVHGAHVETGALIGIGAIVLGGARIGAGTLVAAGAVVPPRTILPAGVLAAGVPCRIVRELTDADRQTFAETPERYAERAALHRTVNWTAPA
jgi:carbonic anhydrase/acetyltransferase-like protein (isoleucine patch superfamily)